jgi:translation initiation factor 2 subunit 2
MEKKTYDYEFLYDRAKRKIPAASISGERFKLPAPDLFFEGKTTIFRNFRNIQEIIRREEKHFAAYLLKELGTAGYIDEGRLIFKSRITPEALSDRINNYLSTYVLCSECGRPDTHITKEERVSILVCEACGASRPITGGKAKARSETPALKEGMILELTITECSRRGEGVAHYENYVIFVTNARVKIGDRVRVKILKISKNTAFAALSA